MVKTTDPSTVAISGENNTALSAVAVCSENAAISEVAVCGENNSAELKFTLHQAV